MKDSRAQQIAESLALLAELQARLAVIDSPTATTAADLICSELIDLAVIHSAEPVILEPVVFTFVEA
jgi:hypothetical protein